MSASLKAKSEDIDLDSLNWFVINDDVMGGVSRSRVTMRDNLIFEGKVSLENNGGFASFRTPFSFQDTIPNALKITYKPNGKKFQFRMRVDQYYDGPAFVTYLPHSESNNWQSIIITEHDVALMFRGRKFTPKTPFNFADVTSIGFLISSQQSGPFSLEVKEIKPIFTEKT